MEQIYNAEIMNDQINWLDVKPKLLHKNRKYKVQVIIDHKDEKKRNGKKLIDLLRDSSQMEVEIDSSKDKDLIEDEALDDGTRTARELYEAFRNSPLFGIELDLKRVQDTGREIDL
jgi:hypothetical protein